MPIIIKVLVSPSQVISRPGEVPKDWQYLKAYDLEAYDGRGFVAYTNDPSLAMRFRDLAHFFGEYQRSPKNRPRREDGKPNRPLSALSIATEPVDH